MKIEIEESKKKVENFKCDANNITCSKTYIMNITAINTEYEIGSQKD